ncbi:MAG: cob(I)yrinic acid a,c-diamide adenosyltransferase [Chitinophagaceae bacterium]|nr:MAG: cob(I)yrinic acid a,c-diamide adenosyltransferase [Chitinophagaceae bacterium]
MSFKIYTKTGDKGTTSLIGGVKVSKAHLRIEAYGTVDELNSYVGLCKDTLKGIVEIEALQEIQDRLFTVGAVSATPTDKTIKMKLPDIHEEDIIFLEKEIDTMDANIPPMKSFILPGGSVPISNLHIARCVCRRAERSAIRLQEAGEEVPQIIVKYLNRLSDYLFVLSRFTAVHQKIEDIPWKPRV